MTDVLRWVIDYMRNARETGEVLALEEAEAMLQAELVKRPRRKRKVSVSKIIAQAEKSGKLVSSVTAPDGTKLTFGEPEPTEASNPWLADLDKVTKQ